MQSKHFVPTIIEQSTKKHTTNCTSEHKILCFKFQSNNGPSKNFKLFHSKYNPFIIISQEEEAEGAKCKSRWGKAGG